MSDPQLVSIIMPTFNTARYIKEAVNSVISQTWQNWELIIINDGSTDETSSILQNFCDKRITVIEQINSGVSAARNAGLKVAKGEFVTFLDADDVLPVGSLEARATFLMSHPDIDIVDGRILAKNESLDKVLRLYKPYYTGPLLPRLLALDDRVFFGPFYFLRTSLITDSRFKVGMSHAEDLLFFTQLAHRQQLRYSFVDEDIYYYRTGTGSAMSNIDGLEEGYLDFLRVVLSTIKIDRSKKCSLKAKISKIMFLTWLSKREYLRAIRSIYMIAFRT